MSRKTPFSVECRVRVQLPDGTHHCFVGKREFEERDRRGDFEVVRTLKSGDTIARLKPPVETKRSMKEASKPCITYADMLANVGLTDRPHSTVELSRGKMLAAQAKIAEFGKSWWAFAPAPVSTEPQTAAV